MPKNPTQEIVEYKFAEFRKSNFPNLSQGDAFNQFAVRIALRPHALSDADIGSGIVDGKDDGGLDSFHIVVNRTQTITNDTKGLTTNKAPADQQRGVPFDIVITQAKSQASGWDKQAIWKLRETIERILDPRQTSAMLREVPLNEKVIGQTEALRKYQRKLVSLDPVRSFTVCVMTPVGESGITKPMRDSALALKKSIQSSLPSSTTVRVELIGAEGMDKLLTQEPEFEGIIKFSKPPVRVNHGKSQAWLGLVTVKEYLAFLRRGKTEVLREEFFSANVRDFAGPRNAVNSAIRATLSKDTNTAFWWMNNGVTILADEAKDQTDEQWLLTNPQIVNGLQSSNVIHEAAIEKAITPKRMRESLLVRIIRENQPAVRESIITGTNNQTAVSSLQLYANDEFQRRLETFLLTKGWYYERRRWQYRNAKAPASKIRNIQELGQAVIAVHLMRPDTARARPGDLLRTKAGYKSVFDPAAPEPLFSTSLDIVEAVEKYLHTTAAQAISTDVTNDRYYLVSGAVLRGLDVTDLPSYSGHMSVSNIKVPDAQLLEELHKLLYSTAGPITDVRAKDALFKGNDLRDRFFSQIIALNSTSPHSWTVRAKVAKAKTGT